MLAWRPEGRPYGGLHRAAWIFFAITVLTGDYSWVARVGGSAWVLMLSMIILMPTVTPWMRRRLEG